uniref:Gnk2-homologous domain-containing protein n=1 Tax=Fagus sylvatica TaxID=28930 RepID=A0A2N9F935_FAGSY
MFYKLNLLHGPDHTIMGMPSFSVSMLLVVLSLLNFISEAQRPGYPFFFCPEETTFTPNSTYQSNLNHLLSSLTSNANRESGYYNTTAGQSPGTTIYGLFLCRGDLTPEKCQKCVATATKEIIEKYCPVGKVAVIWYNECMLRYSNQSFLSTMDDTPIRYQHHSQDMPDRFTQLLATTLNDIISRVLNSPSGAKKFATKTNYTDLANYTDLQTLYTLVQCIPVLLSTDCNMCLLGLIGFLPNCCNGKQGAVAMNPSCNIRYEVYPFYQLQVNPSPAPLLAPPAPGNVPRPKG